MAHVEFMWNRLLTHRRREYASLRGNNRMMSKDVFDGKYRIATTRLPGYDYGANGMYFVTICTLERAHFFGSIEAVSAILHPSTIGLAAIDCWNHIPTYFPFVYLDAFQLMPNHLHGIICIDKAEAQPIMAWKGNHFGPQYDNLAAIIRGFKAGVKKYANLHHLDFGWQPRYYDRVIRNQNELERIRQYIAENPAKWIQDQNNTENLYM